MVGHRRLIGFAQFNRPRLVPARRPAHRLLRCESLEDRQMLSAQPLEAGDEEPSDSLTVFVAAASAPVAAPAANDHVLNGRSPALLGSQAGLQLSIDDVTGVVTVQWTSRDAAMGVVQTSSIQPRSVVITGDDAPARVVFDATEGPIRLLGNIVLEHPMRGVVELVWGPQRVKYLLDAAQEIPCTTPTHAELEIFAKIHAYEPLQQHQQLLGFGYRVDRVFNDTTTGFFAAGLTCGEAPPVLAVRGTEPGADLAIDLLDDLNVQGIGFDQFTANYSAVAAWLNQAAADTGQSPIITGHSLGGGLSQFIASRYTGSAAEHWLHSVVTFNAPGISRTFADQFRPGQVVAGVRHYINSGDIVSLAGEAFIAGGYTLAVSTFGPLFSAAQLNPLNKHTYPMLAASLGGLVKPPTTLTAYNNVAWLSSPLFAYATPDHYVLLTGIATVLGPIVGPANALGLSSLLVFRGTAEAARKAAGIVTADIRTAIQQINAILAQLNNTGQINAHVPLISIKLHDFVELRVENMRVRYNPAVSSTVYIQGVFRIPQLLNLTGNFSGGNYIGIHNQGLDVVGTISVSDVTIAPSWTLTNLTLSIDTVNQRYGINGTMTFGPHISFSLPLTPISFSGRIAEAGISGRISRTLLSASGHVSVLGGLASTDGSITIDFLRKQLTVTGSYSMLSDNIAITGVLRGDSSFNITLGGEGDVRAPEGIWLIGGRNLSSGGSLLNYYHSSDLAVLYGWGYLFGRKIGFRLRSDQTLPRVVGAGEIPALPSASPAADRPQASPPAGTAMFPLAAGRAALLAARWENEQAGVRLELVDPDGLVYDEAALLAHPQMHLVDEFSDARNRVVFLENPAPGAWSLRIVDPQPLEGLELAAFQEELPAEIDLLTPESDVGASAVSIQFDARVADGPAVVRFYRDADRQAHDGVLIGEMAVDAGGPGEFLWDTSGVPAGDYYLYAEIETPSGFPEISRYAAGRVRVVDGDAPAAVAALQADWVGDDRVRLSWDAVAGAAAYLVQYTADAAGEFYDESFATFQDDTSVELSGLVVGETYRFTVTALNAENRLGAAGTAALVIVGPDALVPPEAGQWDVFADPGSTYTASIELGPGDSAVLSAAPGAAQLAALGEFTWSVPVGAAGFSQVVIHVHRAGGHIDVIRRFLYSDPARIVPPGVTAVGFTPGDGNLVPSALAITFSRDVSASLSLDDLEIVALSDGTPLAAEDLDVYYDLVNNVATVTFPGFADGRLPAGDYRLTIQAAGVQDALGIALAADFVFPFTQDPLPLGEAGAVETSTSQSTFRRSDVVRMLSSYGGFGTAYPFDRGMTSDGVPAGDFNRDGVVSLADLALVQRRLETAAPAAAPLAVAAAVDLCAVGIEEPSAAPAAQRVASKRAAHRLPAAVADRLLAGRMPVHASGRVPAHVADRLLAQLDFAQQPGGISGWKLRARRALRDVSASPEH